MPSGWLDWAIDDPAPPHCGYSFLNVPCELADPSLRRGLVIHSVEGWFAYTSPSAVMRARGSSWAVTIMRSGQVWRHRPRPTFVNWHGGGPAQNIGTDGIEMEGKNQPWTPEQRASLLRVLVETWEWFGWTEVTLGRQTDCKQETIRRALLARDCGSLWEHRWFDYTSCPSGRNDWGWLIPALEAEMARLDEQADYETFCKMQARWMAEQMPKLLRAASTLHTLQRSISAAAVNGCSAPGQPSEVQKRINTAARAHVRKLHGADSGGQGEKHSHEVLLPDQVIELPGKLIQTSKAG